MVTCCEWLGGEPVEHLRGLNQLAWDVCYRAVTISPADFNGTPTLASLQLALDSVPNRLTEYEYDELLTRVALVYQEFWVRWAAEKRREQGQ